MTPRQQHRQRCETCTNHLNAVNGREVCDLLGRFLNNRELNIVDMLGCASHSSSPAAGPVPAGHRQFNPLRNPDICEIEKQAAAEGRAEVLDALCKINTDDNVCKKGKNCKECMIDSLRQNPEQQEQAGERQ